MSYSAFAGVDALRAAQRRRRQIPLFHHLRRAMGEAWLRRREHATAQAVRRLGHSGVSADFQMACRGQ